jgi:gluconokinase
MNSAGEVILGLDVGTTAVKVVAFPINTAGTGGGATQPASTQREYPLQQPEAGWQVQDPTTVLAAIDDAIKACVALLGDIHITALAISTAMHDLIGLDQQMRPITPLVLWADSRATAEARLLRSRGLAQQLLARTGTPVHPMSPLVKLMWFARHEPEVATRVRWWLGLKSYVLLHLTGQLVTELSSASATGLLDLQSMDWDPHSLELAGITREQLPQVLPTTTVLALTTQAAPRTGLPADLPVAVGAADGPLGNLGTGAIEPGIAGLSLGTSGAVRMAVPTPSADPAGRLFCYALTDDLWVLGGAVSNGGITLRWAGETFAPDLLLDGPADAEVLALAAQVPAGSEGLIMLPYVLSERAPLWDPDITGAFLGVRHHHTRSHFIRAAVEGVCLQVSIIVNSLDAISPVQSIRATGGPFRSVLWQRVMAAVLGRPLYIEADAGGTALGAAALGWYALGNAPTLSEAVAALSGPPSEANSEPVAVTAEEVASYAQIRAGIPALINSYRDVAALFA